MVRGFGGTESKHLKPNIMAKEIKIEHRGELPSYVKTIVDTFSGKKIEKGTIDYLDQEIAFCVTDLRQAHGNLNKHDKSAWLCPANGDNSFNVTITF